MSLLDPPGWFIRLNNRYMAREIRPVKHRRAYFFARQFSFWAVSTTVYVTANETIFGLLDNKGWQWPWLFAVLLTVNFLNLLRTCWVLSKRESARYFYYDKEILNIEDKGEHLETGPGFRHVKATEMVTRGEGRYKTVEMHELEFAIDPNVGKPKLLRSTEYPNVDNMQLTIKRRNND